MPVIHKLHSENHSACWEKQLSTNLVGGGQLTPDNPCNSRHENLRSATESCEKNPRCGGVTLDGGIMCGDGQDPPAHMTKRLYENRPLPAKQQVGITSWIVTRGAHQQKRCNSIVEHQMADTPPPESAVTNTAKPLVKNNAKCDEWAVFPKRPSSQENNAVWPQKASCSGKTAHLSHFAVLVTGLTRTLQNTWPSLLTSVVRPSAADVFIHVYTDREVRTTWRKDGMREDDENRNRAVRQAFGAPTGSYHPASLIAALDAYDEVKRVTEEVFRPEDNKVNSKSGTSVRIVSQSRQMMRGLAVIDEYTASCRWGVQYKLVLRTRPDIGYPSSQPFAFDKFLHASRAAHLETGKHALFLPLSDDHAGMNDQLAVGSPHVMRNLSQWGHIAAGLDITLGQEEALQRQVLEMLEGPFVLRRFYYEYSLVRPRDAYMFTYMGPELWSHYNNNAYLWKRIKCKGGYTVIDVGSDCSFNPVSDGHVDSGYTSQDQLKCHPVAKGCQQTQLANRAQMLRPLRAEIMHLVCGFHEPNEATRKILRDGVSEAHRCVLSVGLVPMMREILWNRCCRHLPSDSGHTSFPAAIKAAAPDCSLHGGDLDALNSVLFGPPARDCAPWQPPQPVPGLAQHSKDAFAAVYTNLSSSMDWAFVRKSAHVS